jgi:hypothetical protein
MFFDRSTRIKDAQRARRLAPLLILTLALLSLVVMPFQALAQSGQGVITGRVTDASGAVVPNVTVTITATDTGVSNTTQTNSSGQYTVESLNPGTYSVTATGNGFKKEVVDKITLSTGATVEQNLKLSVGSKGDTITVTSTSSLLTKDISDVITTVDHQIVENLPYPERSSLEAVLLVPGVTGDTLNPGGIEPENPNAYTNYFSPGASISIGGAPPGSAAIIIDGSDVTEASFPRAGMNLSGQMVQEVSVITAGASAQYGRNGGGAIVETSRAGTSQYHGALTWMHTDPYFWAIEPGDSTKTDQHEQWYGAYLGGPVRIPHVYNGTDKTFFFFGFEPGHIHEAGGAQRAELFTPAELAGQFHNSLDILNQTILKSSGYAAALAAPRTGGVGYNEPHGASYAVNPCAALDPSGAAGIFPCGAQYASTSSSQEINGALSDCTNNGITQADFANPTVCHDDLAQFVQYNKWFQNVASLYPTPSNPGPYITFDNAQGTSATDLTNGTYKRGVLNQGNRYNIRIDHQFNNSNNIYARYTVIPVNAQRFFAIPPSNPMNQVATDVEHGHDIAIGYTHIFSNTLVNNLHYSWFRENLQRLPPGSSETKDFAASFGLTPALAGYGYPKAGSFNSNGDGYTIQIGNGGSNGYVQNVDQNFVGGDDLTWTHGTHNISVGVDIRWIQSNQYDLGGLTGGSYSFSPTQSEAPNGQPTPVTGGGSALGSFLMGVQSGNSNYSNTPQSVPGYYRYKYWGTYFQDNWRVGAKLTLNLGLRYEVQVPREEAHNNQAFVGSNITGTLNGIPTSTSFCFSGACGLGRSLWPTNYWGFEPRIGVAYAMSPTTTLRASYAVNRMPLSGQENTPDPDFSVSGSGTNVVNSNYLQDFISNPIAASSLTSAYTQLSGRGPFNFSTGLAPVFVDQTNAVPNQQSYNVTFQFQPFSKTLLQATYQGLRGEHLYLVPFVAKNTPSLGAIQAAINGNAYLGATFPNTYGILANNNVSGSISTESGIQFLEPYQNFYNQSMTNIYQRTGDQKYNGMYVSINQRATKTLTLLANYRWSKSLDDVPDVNNGAASGSGQTNLQTPFSLRPEYSVSTFDQDSALQAGYNLNLPFGIGQRFKTGNGFVDRLIGNFSTSGTALWTVGFPNYVTLGNSGYFYSIVKQGTGGTAPGLPAGDNFACPANTANGGNYWCQTSILPSGYTLRPNIVPGVPLIKKNWRDNPYNSLGPGGITPYLNSLAFTVPGAPLAPALGNAPRTLSNARSPRGLFFDASIKKGITIRERYQLALTIQGNNVLNHPNYFASTNRSPYTTATANSNFAPNGPTPATSTINPFVGVATFGELGNAGATVMARVVRVGAQFTF